jgi:hypothetical protein
MEGSCEHGNESYGSIKWFEVPVGYSRRVLKVKSSRISDIVEEKEHLQHLLGKVIFYFASGLERQLLSNIKGVLA